MAKWIFLGAPWLVCLVSLAPGAWPPSSPPLPPAAAFAFVARPMPSSPSSQTIVLDGARFLERSIESLTQVQWLRVTVWQQLHDPHDGYQSVAHLTLGPNQCARLETSIRTSRLATESLVISDGHVLADVKRFRGQCDQVTSLAFPVEEKPGARARFLEEHGCASPVSLLRLIAAQAKKWHVEFGESQGRAVMRMAAEVAETAETEANLAGGSVRLYLDAATLWPCRIEWWRAGAGKTDSQLQLELEFREPEINRPLSAEQCARVFTYEAQAESATKHVQARR